MYTQIKIFSNLMLVLSISFLLFFQIDSLNVYANSSMGVGQGRVCTHSKGWVKFDNLSGYTFFYEAQANKLIAEVCHFSAGNAYYETIDPASQSVLITSKAKNSEGEMQEISHATFRLIDNPEYSEDTSLRVNKSAKTYFTRTWDWSIEKEVDIEEVTLKLGEKATLNYTVRLNSEYEDGGWVVYGTVFVKNRDNSPVLITDIKDIILPNLETTVTCPHGLPYSLGAKRDLTCTYYRYLPSKMNGMNTAGVYIDNELRKAVEKSFSFKRATFDNVDECVYLSDSLYDVGDNKYCSSSVVPYSVEIEGKECGVSYIENEAKITFEDTKKILSDKAVVKVIVDDEGCSYNGDEEDDEDIKDEEDVKGDEDVREVKGATTIVHAPTSAGDSSTIYLIQSVLLILTGFSLIYVGREYINRY